MALSGIPADVERFLVAHIHSVEHLEILLLLIRARPSAEGAGALAEQLGIEVADVTRVLADFTAKGVLRAEGSPEEQRYRFDPASHVLLGAGLGLENASRQQRDAVLRLIINQPNSTVRAFSDAFRLRP